QFQTCLRKRQPPFEDLSFRRLPVLRRAKQLVPIRIAHVRRPTLVKAASDLLGDLDAYLPTKLMISREGSHRLLIIERIPPGDCSGARGGCVKPVLQVVLPGHPGRAGVSHVVPPQIVLRLFGCIFIDKEETPSFSRSGAVRMPSAKPAWLPAMVGG